MFCDGVKAIVWVCDGLKGFYAMGLGQCGGSRGLPCVGG